jgi:transposase
MDVTPIPDNEFASLRRLVAERDAELAVIRAERDGLRACSQASAAEVEKLRLLIKQLQRALYGRRSEKLDPDQLQFGLEDLEQSIGMAEAAQEAASPGKPDGERRAATSRRNRGNLPQHLPREEIVIAPQSTACPCCGGAMHVIGEEASEQLDIVPAQLKVIVTRRPRYGCRTCEGAVVQAPAPNRPIDGGMATEALIAHVIVSKYADHCPLYRQAQIFARQGIELDRSTLAGWVGRAAWWLDLLYERLLGNIIAAPVLFSDDTPLPVLDPGRGRTKTARLWAYGRDERAWRGCAPPAVAYVFTEGRGHEHPLEHLKRFKGVLQVDAYQAYDRLAAARQDGSVALAHCWAHARRKFYEVEQATGSPIAAEAIRRIGELYAVEAEIRGRAADERQRIRQAESLPLGTALKQWLEEQRQRVSGKGKLAEAIRYMLARWPSLTLFLEDGRIAMDTNTVERAIRPIALGRKNALFAGSHGGGRTWAIIASLIQTAKLNEVEPFAYLRDVLQQLVAGHPATRLDELLPWNWKTTTADLAA